MNQDLVFIYFKHYFIPSYHRILSFSIKLTFSSASPSTIPTSLVCTLSELAFCLLMKSNDTTHAVHSSMEGERYLAT